MHRNDKSKYVLYIEPKREEKLTESLNDKLTQLVELALSKAKVGTGHYSSLDDMGDGFDWATNRGIKRIPSFDESSMYKGVHRTECGEHSTNCDYLLENGMITNSLATFYVQWYRNSIHENDMNKLKELGQFYNIEL